MQMRRNLFLIGILFFYATSLNKGVTGTPIIVTVQTQSQQQLDELTAAVEADSQLPADESGGRHLLGAIEATQSHVVDVQNAYSVTQVQSIYSDDVFESLL